MATLVISAIFTILLAALVGIALKLSSRRRRPGDGGGTEGGREAG